MEATIQKIEKEQIPQIALSKREVLKTKEDKARRKLALDRALTLGNGHKSKVKILFMLENGEKKLVETTIWAVGNDFISLKAGILIPVHSILEVEL